MVDFRFCISNDCRYQGFLHEVSIAWQQHNDCAVICDSVFGITVHAVYCHIQILRPSFRLILLYPRRKPDAPSVQHREMCVADCMLALQFQRHQAPAADGIRNDCGLRSSGDGYSCHDYLR